MALLVREPGLGANYAVERAGAVDSFEHYSTMDKHKANEALVER